MTYGEACGERLSRLGFGCMRLPLTAGNGIDETELRRMTDFAIENGVNYFDTAWPYHGGLSEIAVGKALARHPREKWFLADKYPGHQIASAYRPAEIFEEQLKKCGVEYFDFYLLHNVYENSFGVYTSPEWDILNYFLEQKRLGRIRHLGFSSHARPDTLEKFLDYAGDSMEFCQIQLNYLDWTLQDAKAKYELLTARNIPVWVMEPLRGGKLAALPEADEKRLKALRPAESAASWSFRWLQNLPNVKVVLSGMSDFAQMADNHPLPLLLRGVPHGAGHPHADPFPERSEIREQHDGSDADGRAAGGKAARRLHWLRRVRRGMPPEDRYPRGHGGAGGKAGGHALLGRAVPAAGGSRPEAETAGTGRRPVLIKSGTDPRQI